MRCSNSSRVSSPLLLGLLLGLTLALLAGQLVAQEAQPPAAESDFGVRRDLPAPAGAPRSGTELDRITEEVSEELRCPMCQGLSVADSPSASAQAIKDEVRSLLAEGFSEDQVKGYFEGTYGEFVLLDPKRKGLNWLLWLAPGVVFLGGLGWIAATRRSGSESATVPAGEDLDPYLERVRRLAETDDPSEQAGP